MCAANDISIGRARQAGFRPQRLPDRATQPGGARAQGERCARRKPPLRGLTSVSGHATALRVSAPGKGRSRRAANRGKGPARGQPCAAASSASRGARDTLSRVQRRPVRQRRHGARLAPQRSSMAVTLRPAHGRSRPQATAGAALAGSHSGLPQRVVSALSRGWTSRDRPCRHGWPASIRQRSQVTKALGALHFAV